VRSDQPLAGGCSFASVSSSRTRFTLLGDRRNDDDDHASGGFVWVWMGRRSGAALSLPHFDGYGIAGQ
jgi:hypothetical protein